MPRGRHRTKVIQLNRINGNFGLKLVGGCDLKIPPSVAELQPGGAAELSQKIGVGDLLLSIDGRDVHAFLQIDVIKALLKSPDSCQFIFQTNIYIRESVLEIISLRYMQKFKKGECAPSPNNTNFQDGELCTASQINSVSRPYGQRSNSPAPPPKIPEPSPPTSLSSANGTTTTTDSCTESTESEHNIENAQPTSQAQLPLSQRRVSVELSVTEGGPALYKVSDTDCLPAEPQTSPSKKDSPTLNLYVERPGSLADLLEKDKYNYRPPPLSECEINVDFGSHPNISSSRSWHRLNQDSRREFQQEVLFCPNYGSVYCESLGDSVDDDLNSLCSDYSRSTSVISNASSMLSNRESTRLDAIVRKNRSLSSLSLDARLRSKNMETPNSENLGRKSHHVHTTSDFGPENYLGIDNKYGSLPQVLHKNSSDKYIANSSKLSAPTSHTYKLEIDSPPMGMSPEDTSEIKKKAWRMYKLEDYTDQEVCQMLAPDTVEARELGILYSNFFDFKEIDVVDAFRMYLRHLKLEGESQEQDRIVEFFSKRYNTSNPYKIGSADAIHVLVCSLLLLNADLHGQNLGKSMTFKDFYENLMGQCDCKNFSTTLLKECYTSIKKKTLETGCQAVQTSSRLSVRKQEEKRDVIIPIENSMVSVSLSTESKPLREGLLYVKNITDTEGKRTTGKQRHWKAFYAQIRGPLLVLWSMADTKRYLSDYRRVYPLTHALARPCPEYTKRHHALRIITCQRQVILVDARDLLDMQGWVSAINLAAALHSSEPMAGALGSSTTFSRPTIPIGPSNYVKEKQIIFLEKTIEELENDLERYSPDKLPLDQLKNKPKPWVKDMLDYRNFLASEVHRYRVYIGCIDLNDKDNLFQQKPVYYISRLLQKEFEPIIEAPEEAAPSPKFSN